MAQLATACDNKSVASCQQTYKLLVDYFNRLVALEKVCKLQAATSLILTDLLQVDEIDQLVETFDKLQQAGKLGPAWVCNVLPEPLSHSLVD